MTALNGKRTSQAKHRISSFETGDLMMRSWGPYREQILDFLQERDAPPGDYSVRVNRRVRSALAPGETRLRPFQRNAIVLFCRPDGADNGGIYECLIIGEFKDWNVRDMHFYFEKFESPAVPEGDPETIEAPAPEARPPTTATTAPTTTEATVNTPATPKPTLSEKLARLERIAGRAIARDQLLKEIEAKMTATKQELAELETKYLQVLHEVEADEECRRAADDLKALERLLGE